MKYEIRIPAVGVFTSRTIESAIKRAKRERAKAAKASGGSAPHAAIFDLTTGKRVEYIA